MRFFYFYDGNGDVYVAAHSTVMVERCAFECEDDGFVTATNSCVIIDH